MCLKMSVSVIFLLILMFTLADCNSCSPCKCERSVYYKLLNKTEVISDIKYADCSTNATNSIILRAVPYHLDSQIEDIALKGQPLKYVPEDAFSSVHLVNLKIINLMNCNINSVHANGFRDIPNLTKLSLSFNELTTLDTKVFHHNLKLTKLYLANNKLTVIPAELFANLTLLQILDISNNSIYHIDKFALINNQNLQNFWFRFNELTYINPFIFENLTKLMYVIPVGNPWSCDCRVKKLKSVITFLFPNPRCMEPKKLRGKNWHILKSDAFSCWIHINLQQNVTHITVHDDSVVLSCMAEAFPEPNLTWMYANRTLDLDTSNNKYQLSRYHLNNTMYCYNLTIFNVTSTDRGLYTCKLNNTEQEVEKRFNLTIKPATLPVILAPIDSVIMADVETENFTLACKVSSIPRPDIKWIYLDADKDMNMEQTYVFNSTGVDSDSYWSNLTISHLSPKYNGKYWCMASNSKGRVTKVIMLMTRSYLPSSLIFLMIVGCGMIAILMLIFIIKCINRFYATQNMTQVIFKS